MKPMEKINNYETYSDYHTDKDFWMAIADGDVRFHEMGYLDDDGRVFDQFGTFLGLENPSM